MNRRRIFGSGPPTFPLEITLTSNRIPMTSIGNRCQFKLRPINGTWHWVGCTPGDNSALQIVVGSAGCKGGHEG
jgi:hypothetical protein